jgi:hypothetical protein
LVIEYVERDNEYGKSINIKKVLSRETDSDEKEEWSWAEKHQKRI